MKIVRTPEDRFTNLPDFVFVPRYAQVTHDDVALRMAYLDEGSGPVMLLLHGEPSWSFLYRSMVPPLVEAGFRVVAPDLIGSADPTNRWRLMTTRMPAMSDGCAVCFSTHSTCGI